MRHKTIVPGVTHRCIEESIDMEGSRVLVEFIFDWLPADGNLDDDVDVVGRVRPDGDCFDTHAAHRRRCLCGGSLRPVPTHAGMIVIVIEEKAGVR